MDSEVGQHSPYKFTNVNNRRFVDLSAFGPVQVTEYEDTADHFALLLSFGDQASIKISADAGKELHSALLRVYETCVQ